MDLLHSHAFAFDFALFVFTYIERISNTVCNKNLLKHFLSRFTDLFYLLKMKCIILFEPVMLQILLIFILSYTSGLTFSFKQFITQTFGVKNDHFIF